MKKLYFLLLAFFCTANTAFGQISDEELFHEMQRQSENLPMEDQQRMAHITMLAQTNRQDQLTQDDVDFYNKKHNELITNATDAIIKAKKIAAEEAKKAAKALVNALRSAPQGPCPYTEKDIKQKEILEKTIALINEVVYYNKNNPQLETAIVTNAPSYKIKSKATSPYNSTLATLDGTTLWTMPQHGKLTMSQNSIEPENEFDIEIKTLDNDTYQIDIIGYNTCNVPWDYMFQRAHRNLAICNTKYLIDQDKDGIAGTIQATVEGQDYKAPSLLWRSTYCSDHRIQIICKKEHLIYSIKEALAQKNPSMNNDQKTTELQALAEQQAADDLEAAIEQEKFEQDAQEWTEWKTKTFNSIFARTTKEETVEPLTQENVQVEEHDVASDRTTDLQQLQQEEVNTAS